jgi:hypothetical protein
VAEFGVGFRFYGKTDELAASLRQAGEEGKQLKKTLGDTFGDSSIWKSLSVVGAVTMVIRGFMIATENAQKLREESEKLGRTLDVGTASVARLADAFDEFKKIGANALTSALSTFTLWGEAIGSLINRQRGITAEQEKLAEQSVKAVEDAEKRLIKSREENSPEKIIEAEKRLADARIEAAMKNADEVGKVFLLMQRELAIKEEIVRVGEKSVKGLELQGQLEKTRAEIIAENRKDQEKLAKENEKLVEEEFKAIDETLAAREKLKKLRFDLLPAAEQEVQLQRELYELEKEFRQVKAAGLETTDVEILLLEKGNELAKVRAEIAKEIAKQGERAVEAEVQKNRVMAFRGGATFNEQSDETLREIIRRNQEQASRLQAEGIGQPQFVASLNLGEASRLRFEAQNAQAILDAREELRRNVRMMGVEGARQTFRGDPIVFESMVQRFVEDTRSTQEIQRENGRQLTDINQRLLKAGFGK